MLNAKNMNEVELLSAALGYPFQIPTAPITRSVRMLFTERHAIEPYMEKKKFIPKKHRKDDNKNGLGHSHKTILKMVKKLGTATAADVCKGTLWTQNHCSMILTALYKKGLIKRHKASGNGTRWYIYKSLEGA